jgi:hypothetical protein
MEEKKPNLVRIRRGQAESAPLTPDEVSMALQTGDLKPTDEYWIASENKWRQLAELDRGPLGGLPEKSTVHLQRLGEMPFLSVLVMLIFIAGFCVIIPLLVSRVTGTCVVGSVINLFLVVCVILVVAFFIAGGVFPLRNQSRPKPKTFTTPTDAQGNTVDE